MNQLNMHMTPAFEKALTELMKIRGIPSKSQAIRVAVEEELARYKQKECHVDFTKWIGEGKKAALNPKRQFKTDWDLWKE